MGHGLMILGNMLADGEYDPEKLGARCSECVLKDMRTGGPVGPEIRPDADIAVIAEAPAEKEVEVGRPLVGPGGLEFNNALKALGIKRQSLNLHHAVACQAPQNDLDRVMLKWQRGNKKRAKEGLLPLPSPIECCRPRLLAELDDKQRIITLGKVPYTALTQRARSIMDIRGGPVEAQIDQLGNFTTGVNDPNGFAIRVLPTLHPAFVMRTRRWSRAFRSDLSRAVRWFTVGLGWKEPHITLAPSPDELAAFLSRTDIDYTVDVETTIDDPTVAKLKTVGIGHELAAMVVPFLSIEGPGGTLVPTPAYSDADMLSIRGILRDFFIDTTRMKIGHNAGYFDQMVIKKHFGVPMEPLVDTILLHRVVEPELPHKLGYVGSVYTDVVAWKDAHTATEAKTDYELQHYNAVDCVVTARVVPQLMRAVEERQQASVVAKDHRVQQVCVGLHENGMLVDRKARDEVAKELLLKIDSFKKHAHAVLGREINMNSVPQLRDLLFEKWKLEPVEYTKLGDPSTNDESVRIMRSAARSNPALEDPTQVVAFLDTLRKYRKYAKEYGTYVRRLIPYNAPLDGFAFNDENEQEESQRGLIMADGRIRADYNAHGTTSGRLSSSNPNCFSGDTEVLTLNGWVRFDALPKGVSVAQYHEDKQISWTVPTDYIEKEFDGELVHVENQHIDLMMTPDHRCLLRNRKTGELRVFAAKDYPEDWQQLHAGTLLQYGHVRPSVGLLMLIVAAQADGSWVKGTKNRRLTFKFTKERKIARLRTIIEMLEGDVVVRIDKEAKNGESIQRRIEIEGHAVDRVFEYIGQEKQFDSWLLDMPSWLALLFCDEVFYWDGCFTRRNQYSSNSKNNADWVQAMFSITGTRANVRPYAGKKNTNWQVDVTRRDYSMTTNVERKSVPYTGKVYCVSVPSSYIIVRRNGKVSVTGNCQNWPKHLRKLIIPAPGNVIVGADADQLELRIITAIAQIQIYLEAFADKKDPHAMTASLMFGRAFDQLEPKSEQWSKLRTIAKGIKYASFYGSGDETVHGLVTSAEDENGNLMYPDLSVREVATLKRNWLKGIPELPKWWDTTVESFRRDGYIRDPVWGRQRDFLDGEAFNEIVNHPIQSAGAHIIHESTFDLLNDIPFGKWGPNTGLISQVHDALYVECPESEAAWVEGMLKKHMNRAVYGLDGVEFAAKPKTGKTWADV